LAGDADGEPDRVPRRDGPRGAGERSGCQSWRILTAVRWGVGAHRSNTAGHTSHSTPIGVQPGRPARPMRRAWWRTARRRGWCPWRTPRLVRARPAGAVKRR
jgi:hypothetical protein